MGEGQWLRPAVVEFLLSYGLIPVARDFQARYQYNLLLVTEEVLARDRFRNALAHYYSRLGGHGK
jgi:hypothetical protein